MQVSSKVLRGVFTEVETTSVVAVSAMVNKGKGSMAQL